MGCGGSVGEGYGPMVVSSKPLAPEELGRIKIAVPGTLTTAYLALKIFNPEIQTVTVPFDKIIPAILAGDFEAGLIIHEGQLTYSSSGLYKVLDLGVWWRETTGLVLPLGGNAIRRSLGAESLTHRLPRPCATAFSTPWTTANRRWSTPCSLPATWTPRMASRFVSMYVNERTLDYGADGREAIRKLLDLGHERGIIPIAPQGRFRRLNPYISPHRLNLMNMHFAPRAGTQSRRFRRPRLPRSASVGARDSRLKTS